MGLLEGRNGIRELRTATGDRERRYELRIKPLHYR